MSRNNLNNTDTCLALFTSICKEHFSYFQTGYCRDPLFEVLMISLKKQQNTSVLILIKNENKNTLYSCKYETNYC